MNRSHGGRRQPPGPPETSGTSQGPHIAEIEAVARIGWYSLDVGADRWKSSPGLDAVLGIDAAFDRSLSGWLSLVHPDDRNTLAAYFANDVLGKRHPFDRRYRIRRADTGIARWVHGRGELTLDDGGRPVRMLGTIADVTEQERDRQALEQSERRYATIFDGSHDAILIADRRTRRFLWANAAASSLLGYSREELLAMSVPDIHPADQLPGILPAFESAEDLVAVPCQRRDGSLAYADIRASSVDIDGIPCVIGFFVDVTAYRHIAARHQRLAAAVAYASDAVLITDPTGAIEYVNPAFERASGYTLEELVGKNPRILKSGKQSAAFYRAMWRRLTGGRTWSGALVNRRRDGSVYEEEVTISPIRDESGVTTGYVGVKRDVTALRASESALEAEFRERAQVAEALARLQPAGTAETTASEICTELLGLPGVSVAVIFDLLSPGRAITLAAAGADNLPLAPGRALPSARAAYLHERADKGAWAEAWRARPEDAEYGHLVEAAGVRAVAYAPIQNGDGLLGVLAAGTNDDEFARHLIEHLPAVGEFAATASALLSGQLEHGHRAAATAERIRGVITTSAFIPVYQPIVTLDWRVQVGYEALTRFEDGTPPDRLIADAHAVGLGVELELVLVAAAVEQAADLPDGLWLSVNVSPSVLLDIDGLAAALVRRNRPVVIEVTEHVAIEDYPAVRAAIAALGSDVSLAVDDAGAGFASLRHVIELRPQYLKLDRTLVGKVDRDLTRQAMVAGLVKFAERSGCRVIAEGIETGDELVMLRGLGIPLGQGYLLGRPTTLGRDRAAKP